MRAAVLLAAAGLALAPPPSAAQSLSLQPQMTALKEGGPTSTVVDLFLDAPAEEPFIVMLETTEITAEAGFDFTPVIAPVTFMPGQLHAQITISIMDDPTDELDTEMFQLAASDILPLGESPVPLVTVATPLLHFTIADNDHTLSVSASGAGEGGAIVIEVEQRFDSSETVNLFSTIKGGTAAPGPDFDPSRQLAYLREGQTRTSVRIPTVADDEKESDETVRIAVQAANEGTVIVEPETVTATIIDQTEEKVRPASLKFGPGTGYVFYEGDLMHQQDFPPETYAIEMRVHIGRSGFTLSQQGSDLPFERVCADDIDLGPAAEAIPTMSSADMRAAGEKAWRAEHVVEDVPFEYVLFGDPDSRMAGYAHSNYTVEDGTMAHSQYFAYVVTPQVEDPEPEVPRLSPDAEPVVDPGAARDSVARAVAADLGMSTNDLRPYLSTALSSGTGSSPVEVHLWLDPDGRPVRPDRAQPDPCDPAYGDVQPAVTRLIYKVHAFEDRFIVQSKTQDVETGRYDSAYMEEFDDASSALDEAVSRAHGGLSPALAAPAE